MDPDQTGPKRHVYPRFKLFLGENGTLFRKLTQQFGMKIKYLCFSIFLFTHGYLTLEILGKQKYDLFKFSYPGIRFSYISG